MPDEPVSDNDLNAAAEEELDQEPTEDPTAEGDIEGEDTLDDDTQLADDELIPDEPDDNAERSRLGRRVSSVEQGIAEIKGMIAGLTGQKREPEAQDTPIDIDPDEPITYRELQEVLRRQKEEESQVDKRYLRAYQAEIDRLGQSADPKVHDAIVTELLAKHHVRRDGNQGQVDAAINYRDAQIALLSKRKSTFGKKDATGAPVGGSLKTQNTGPKPKAQVKLDKYAQDFVDSTGMSNEDVEETLGEPAPGYLRI